MGSPFTADLLNGLADRLDPTAPVGAAILGWQGDPKADALALRVAGGLHALVLSGADPALAAAYPGGTRVWERDGDRDALLDAATEAFAAHPDHFRRFLASPPQTNEVGRSAILFGGFATVARETGLPLSLLEIGASAGLNLHWDAWAYRFGETRQGAADAPLTLAPDWDGPKPPTGAVVVVARAGCDRDPIDPADPDQALRLRAYVWADQTARLERIEAAIAHAAASQVRVERADAADWLAARLAERPEDAATVLTHSIVWQYLAPETRDGLAEIIDSAATSATADRPFAWLRMEPAREAPRHAELRLSLWPGGVERRLAAVDYHGGWIAWGEAGEALIAAAKA